MLKRLKMLASKWLDIKHYDTDIIKLNEKVDGLIEISRTHAKALDDLAPHYTGGSVQAKGRVDYAPNQTGNVVVAEPKILSVERGKH